MGYYLGQFYVDKRDFFIVLAVVLLLLGFYFRFPLPYFSYQNLILLAILFLLAKGFLLSTYDSALFITFFTACVLTLFLPLFQVLLFLLPAFLFMRLLKVI